jgi:hypothetical protein
MLTKFLIQNFKDFQRFIKIKSFQVPKYFIRINYLKLNISKRGILTLKHIMDMLCRACHDKFIK